MEKKKIEKTGKCNALSFSNIHNKSVSHIEHMKIIFKQIVLLEMSQICWISYQTLSEIPVTMSKSRCSHQRCSIEKVFLNILQNSKENTCATVSFLIKL